MLPSTIEILRRGIQLYVSNFRSFAWYLVPIALLSIVQALLSPVLQEESANLSTKGPAALLLLLVFVLITSLSITLIRVAGKLVAHEKPDSFQEEIRASLPILVPYIVVSILVGFASAVAAAFFLIPGFILGTLWMFATYSIILDNRGIRNAFGASASLVKPRFWPIIWRMIGLSILLLIPFLLLVFLLSALFSLFGLGEITFALSSTILGSFVLAPLSAIFLVSIYLEAKADRAPYDEQKKTKDQLASLTVLWPFGSLILTAIFFAIALSLVSIQSLGGEEAGKTVLEGTLQKSLWIFTGLSSLHVLVFLLALIAGWIAYAAKNYRLAHWLSLAPAVTLILYYGQIILFRLPAILTG